MPTQGLPTGLKSTCQMSQGIANRFSFCHALNINDVLRYYFIIHMYFIIHKCITDIYITYISPFQIASSCPFVLSLRVIDSDGENTLILPN